jgi:hypothetical protein
MQSVNASVVVCYTTSHAENAGLGIIPEFGARARQPSFYQYLGRQNYSTGESSSTGTMLFSSAQQLGCFQLDRCRGVTAHRIGRVL